ncbi:MAG TPA: transcription termination/antitermination protein NusG [Acidimicrobiia bacterium]
MPEAVETAETENAEVQAPDVEDSDVETSDLESGLDPSQVDTVELDPIGPVDDEPGEAEEAVVEPEPAEAEAEPEAAPDAAEAEAEPEAAPDAAETEVVEADAGEPAEAEAAAEEEPVVVPPASPYDLPGDWYVIHSYSGYENKVKANLETRIQSMHMEDRIFEVHIPMEDVVEFKAGKKVTVPKKVFPGYILVRMTLDDDSWYAVRNTPGVTGFVAGNAQKPTPLSRREVERFLGVQEEEEKAKPRFKPEWEVGEQVRVVTGPFADFNGVIEDMNVDQQKIVVLVNIFGRDTPVELGFEDIQKN